MAVDVFLKLGDIKGESVDSKHKDEIDVLSWSWGMSNTGTTHLGGGGGAGKVSVQDLHITKYVDKSSPNLMLTCCNGKHFNDATLTVRKAGEDALEYLKITLKTVLVSSVSPGGSKGDERTMESVGLNFASFKVEYTPQDDKGKAGGTVTAGWDIAKNVKV